MPVPVRHRRRVRQVELIALVLLVSAPMAAPPLPFTGGRDVFVAPDGRDDGLGTCDAPLSLARAVSGRADVQQGDRIWLRGGRYRGGVTSRISGSAWAPIRVRGLPGERAVIDNAGSGRDAITVLGSWTEWHDLEITNSDPTRVSRVSGPWPDDLVRGFGMYVRGRDVALVHLTIHDLGNGIGLWEDAENASASGNLVFYNGWQGPDRAHGHGIYTQNRRGERLIAGNIVFGQFSHGIHAYGSSRVSLDHLRVRDNVLFNNGAISADGFARDILVGGGQPVRDLQLVDNTTYGGAQTAIGYGVGCLDAWLTGNYLVGRPPLVLHRCAPGMRDNTLLGDVSALASADDANSLLPTNPDRTVVRVFPRREQPGRAHIVVYNWAREREVSVDLNAAGLTVGEPFVIRDAQDMDGAPVLRGTYAGTAVTVPLDLRRPRRPVGTVPVEPPVTAPEFYVLVAMPARLTGPVTSCGTGREDPP